VLCATACIVERIEFSALYSEPSNVLRHEPPHLTRIPLSARTVCARDAQSILKQIPSPFRNKRICKTFRATICQALAHRITSVSFQKRTGVFSLEHIRASCTLLWAGHIASARPKAHAAVGAGASDRRRPRDDLRQVTRAQPKEIRTSARGRLHRMGHSSKDCTGWCKAMTKRPFGVGKPHLRPIRCDTPFGHLHHFHSRNGRSG
jgi:hypothetical protein